MPIDECEQRRRRVFDERERDAPGPRSGRASAGRRAPGPAAAPRGPRPRRRPAPRRPPPLRAPTTNPCPTAATSGAERSAASCSWREATAPTDGEVIAARKLAPMSRRAAHQHHGRPLVGRPRSRPRSGPGRDDEGRSARHAGEVVEKAHDGQGQRPLADPEPEHLADRQRSPSRSGGASKRGPGSAGSSERAARLVLGVVRRGPGTARPRAIRPGPPRARRGLRRSMRCFRTVRPPRWTGAASTVSTAATASTPGTVAGSTSGPREPSGCASMR